MCACMCMYPIPDTGIGHPARYRLFGGALVSYRILGTGYIHIPQNKHRCLPPWYDTPVTSVSPGPPVLCQYPFLFKRACQSRCGSAGPQNILIGFTATWTPSIACQWYLGRFSLHDEIWEKHENGFGFSRCPSFPSNRKIAIGIALEFWNSGMQNANPHLPNFTWCTNGNAGVRLVKYMKTFLRLHIAKYIKKRENSHLHFLKF